MNNKKRRLLTLLLFPIFGTLFLIGYMLSYYGEKTDHSKRVQNKNKPEASKPMYDFEMQVVEQEKQAIVN
jgi:hypothetical protein